MKLPARPLRITMVNKYYSPPHLGGVETVVRTLSEGLVEHAGARVRALVSNEGRERLEETIGGVSVVRLPRQLALSSAPVAAGMTGALRDEMRREGAGGPSAPGSQPPDVINLHSPYPWGELSFLQASLDVPSVVLYHSDIVRQKRLLTAYRPFLERFLDRVDLIVTSSPNMVRHSPFLAPRAEKCRVVPFGLPAERLAATLAVLRRAAELRAAHAGRHIVLFVGRLVYYKGVDVLVRAMLGVDADLVLIGSGPLHAELRELASAAGIAARVTFLAPQGDDELSAWYHAADVFCLPSVARSEAFGLVQIEAHAAGTPVVSTDLHTGVPYANPDGVTGLIVPPGDALALAAALNRLLGDDELRARLGGQAQARALRELTVPRMVARSLDVYAEAAARHAARAAASPRARHGAR
ncbi:MAG: glycosyltransferase, partial [Actinobacteria bacterium]|nr:glycosyltransferase [Actinomycetota bacterium]